MPPRGEGPDAHPHARELVLLLGYPAFEARRLALELLEAEPDTSIVALVREEDRDFAADLAGAYPPEARARLTFLEGRPDALDLGLSAGELRALWPRVTRIHHAGSRTHLGTGREEAERANVGGAREVIAFARSCPSLRRLVFHSLTSVSGDHRGVFPEESLAVGQSFRNVVEETMARAEKMMRAAARDLPVTVVRSSLLVGDSASGEMDRFDGAYLLVLLVVASVNDLPVPLAADVPLHVVPVDYVVKAARRLGLHPGAAGRTFHLVDPRPPSIRGAFELITETAGTRAGRGFLPSNVTRALARAPGIDRFAKTPRTFLETLATDVRYPAGAAAELLEGSGVTCPPFHAYVGRLVEHVRGRLERRRAPVSDLDVEDSLSLCRGPRFRPPSARGW